MMSSVERESYSCLGCGAESDGAASKCPQCGGAVRGARSIRQRGWWLTILGLLIAVFFAVVIINQAIDVYHSGEPDARVRYTGGSWMIAFMFGTLGLVFFVGIGFVASGIWQIRYGKPNVKVVAAVIGLFSLLMAIAYIVSWFR
jgi:hypothetical protein